MTNKQFRRFSKSSNDRSFNDPDMEKLVVAINDLVSEMSIQTRTFQSLIKPQKENIDFTENTDSLLQSIVLIGGGFITGTIFFKSICIDVE